MDSIDKTFVNILWQHYDSLGREMPWRKCEQDGSFDPYKILVSEMMLQQTQVKRVIPKYREFLSKFPNIQTLANAPLSDVLLLWSGLGYNRRAKYLHEVAKKFSNCPFPRTIDELIVCKGIGRNTAGAVLTYAFNYPLDFIETNVRTVFIHHYFQDRDAVTDSEIQVILKRTLDKENPREFMWAIMDYGSFLKTSGHSAIDRSKHYTKQSRFEGSLRQIRGEILRVAKDGPLITEINYFDDVRFNKALIDLQNEGMIVVDANRISLAG